MLSQLRRRIWQFGGIAIAAAMFTPMAWGDPSLTDQKARDCLGKIAEDEAHHVELVERIMTIVKNCLYPRALRPHRSQRQMNEALGPLPLEHLRTYRAIDRALKQLPSCNPDAHHTCPEIVRSDLPCFDSRAQLESASYEKGMYCQYRQ